MVSPIPKLQTISSATLLGFFPIQPQRFRRWLVGDRKEDSVVARSVFVGMKLPRRHDEDITFVPVHFVGGNFGHASAAKSMVDRCAGVAVRARLFVRAQQLNLTRKI